MAVTIKDVARETNLAISTISKYMNGGNVRDENKELIENAVHKLGYSPNNMARGLRTSKSYTIGLIAGNIDNPHLVALLSEMESKLRELGYSLTYASHDGDPKQAKEYVDYMVEKGVDGIIVDPIGDGTEYLRSVRENKIPLVIVEDRCEEAGDSVQVDCAGGAYEIVEHLIKAGHTRIAVIQGTQSRLTARERFCGYSRVMEDYGYPICEDYVIDGDFSYTAGYEGMNKLWSLNKRPTAVFVTNYDMCLGAMTAINTLGIKVPEELSIVSFDDFELSVMVRPKLTTVKQPLVQVADAACEILHRRINGDYSDFPQKIRIKPECIYRDSVRRCYKKE